MAGLKILVSTPHVRSYCSNAIGISISFFSLSLELCFPRPDLHPLLAKAGERSGFVDDARIIVISDARRGGSGVHAHHGGRAVEFLEGVPGASNRRTDSATRIQLFLSRFPLCLLLTIVVTATFSCPFSEDIFRLW